MGADMSGPDTGGRGASFAGIFPVTVAVLVLSALGVLFPAGLAQSSAERPSGTEEVQARGAGDAELSPLEMSFDGKSTELSSTQIVPTLDTPIEPGKNVIWCASFVAAWKKLESEIAGEPVRLSGVEQTCDRLNAASDPTGSVPEKALYAAAGWVNEGIIKTIVTEVRKRFPGKPEPEFPNIAPDSFLAYAYLEANVKFSIPFFDNRKPLVFTDRLATQTPVRSFGVREEDADRYVHLRRQVTVLWNKWEENSHEWILDLCADSEPSQVIVARIGPKATLADTVAYVGQRIAEHLQHGEVDSLEMKGRLLVPDFFWRIEHHFSELERRTFGNTSLEKGRIDIAQEDIMFRLDKSGAELKSEAKVYYAGILDGPIERYYFIADHPFLVYMKKRGAKDPYFVMWVDNAELLQKW